MLVNAVTNNSTTTTAANTIYLTAVTNTVTPKVGVCLTEPAVLDVGFFLEGGHRALGCVRINNLKLAAAEPLLLVDSAPPPPPPLEVRVSHTCVEKREKFGCCVVRGG